MTIVQIVAPLFSEECRTVTTARVIQDPMRQLSPQAYKRHTCALTHSKAEHVLVRILQAAACCLLQVKIAVMPRQLGPCSLRPGMQTRCI